MLPLALVLGLTARLWAVPVINNPDFNQGPSGSQFDGWTLVGRGVTGPASGILVNTGPGVNAATLYNLPGPYPGGTGSGAIDQAGAEAALGLDPGALQSLNDDTSGILFRGTILYQAITGLMGDQIRFEADYGANFGDVSHDFGFAVLGDPTGADQMIRTGSGQLIGITPRPPLVFTLLRDATALNPLILGFGNFNTADDNEASEARFANIVTTSAVTPTVPELDSRGALPALLCSLTLLLMTGRPKAEA